MHGNVAWYNNIGGNVYLLRYDYWVQVTAREPGILYFGMSRKAGVCVLTLDAERLR